MLRALSKCLLNTHRLGALATSLASLFQCLTTLSVNKCFLTSSLNLPWPIICILLWSEIKVIKVKFLWVFPGDMLVFSKTYFHLKTSRSSHKHLVHFFFYRGFSGFIAGCLWKDQWKTVIHNTCLRKLLLRVYWQEDWVSCTAGKVVFVFFFPSEAYWTVFSRSWVPPRGQILHKYSACRNPLLYMTRFSKVGQLVHYEQSC